MNIIADNLSLVVDDIHILKEISFTIPDARFTCVVGPNGSGKSSILRTIAKDITDYLGFVTDIEHDDMTYLPQDLDVPPFLSTFEIVNLGFYGRTLRVEEQNRAAEELLETCGIVHIKDQPFTSVSVGERQRTWLAFALAQSKELILMDEPLASIDLPTRRSFFKLLSSVVHQGKTLVLVTHDIDLAVEYSDHLICVREGEKLFDGSPSQYQLTTLVSGER